MYVWFWVLRAGGGRSFFCRARLTDCLSVFAFSSSPLSIPHLSAAYLQLFFSLQPSFTLAQTPTTRGNTQKGYRPACCKYGPWCVLSLFPPSSSAPRLQLPIPEHNSHLSPPQKQKQQQAANADAAAGIKKKKVTAAQLRVQKDLSELSLPPTMRTDFPDPDDTLNFTLTIDPDEGMYKGGRFHFTFAIPLSFPHEAPKVKCTQRIYHPNIDLEGNVCLNILREDWKPVLNLQAVIIGLQVSASAASVSGRECAWAKR